MTLQHFDILLNHKSSEFFFVRGVIHISRCFLSTATNLISLTFGRWTHRSSVCLYTRRRRMHITETHHFLHICQKWPVFTRHPNNTWFCKVLFNMRLKSWDVAVLSVWLWMTHSILLLLLSLLGFNFRLLLRFLPGFFILFEFLYSRVTAVGSIWVKK